MVVPTIIHVKQPFVGDGVLDVPLIYVLFYSLIGDSFLSPFWRKI